MRLEESLTMNQIHQHAKSHCARFLMLLYSRVVTNDVAMHDCFVTTRAWPDALQYRRFHRGVGEVQLHHGERKMAAKKGRKGAKKGGAKKGGAKKGGRKGAKRGGAKKAAKKRR